MTNRNNYNHSSNAYRSNAYKSNPFKIADGGPSAATIIDFVKLLPDYSCLLNINWYDKFEKETPMFSFNTALLDNKDQIIAELVSFIKSKPKHIYQFPYMDMNIQWHFGLGQEVTIDLYV